MLPMKNEDRNRLEKKLRLEFNYNSNHIEGNTLTYSETELLLIFGETNGRHEKREFDEIEGHDVAFGLIQQWAADKDKVLTEADIRNLNEIILVKPFWKDAITPDGQSVRRLINVGQYKEHPNSVRLQNGEMFDYASPAETPMLMGDLIQWFRSEEEKKELHPISIAALLHYKFVCIHPFDDGNGRISRLLMNYVLLRNDLPPVIIKSNAKKDYLNALHLADTGNLEAFVNYVGEQLLWSFDIYLKAATGESIEEPGDLEKKLKALKNKLNSNNDVKVERSKSSIITAYKNSVLPLLERIRYTLRQFDNLFKSRVEEIQLHLINDDSWYSTVNFEDIIRYIESEKALPSHVYYSYSLQGVRNTNNALKLDVSVYINFYQLVYELTISVIPLQKDKLYNEVFSDSELLGISERIGNIIFEKIENALQS